MKPKGKHKVYSPTAREALGARFRALPRPFRASIEYGFTVGLACLASYWIIWASGR
jgi:hypothetical protein